MRVVFVVLAMVPLLTGCELLACSGPEYLSFAVVRYSVLPGGTQGVGATAPRWGANEAMNPTDEIQIVFPEGDTLPVDVLELVASDGTPVAFSGEDMFVPTNTEACAHNERHYALDTLAAGNYTLIHRRENGTGDPLNCIEPECPWTTFDGSQVVQLTLTIR